MAEGLVEKIFRMFSISGVRSLVTISHIVHPKVAEMMMKGLVLLETRIQVNLAACLWCTTEKLVMILQYGYWIVALQNT